LSDSGSIRPKLALERAAKGDYIGSNIHAVTAYYGLLLELGFPVSEIQIVVGTTRGQDEANYYYVARTPPVSANAISTRVVNMTLIDPTPGVENPIVRQGGMGVDSTIVLFDDSIQSYVLR
jgi:hypothetical protein